MKVLVTGGRGRVGVPVVALLDAAGCEPVVFDVADGHDIRDLDRLREVARGCRAVVHLAAVPGDHVAPPEEIMDVNVRGTWQVLRLAQELGVSRLVMASTLQVTGLCFAQRSPEFLPVDDAHTCYPSTPYAQSKALGESLCAVFTRVHGMSTVCLRPPLVLTEQSLAEFRAAPRPREEDDVDFNFGSWVHADDVAAAVLAGLRCPDPGHVAVLLSAEDTMSARPTRELLASMYADVPWQGGALDTGDPYRSLIDTTHALTFLGWRPRRRYHD